MREAREFNIPSMTEYVAANLKEEIVSLSVAPGETIAEAELARRYGVSTTPVREALQRLAKDGLIVLSRYRGATVVSLKESDVRDIYQLREALEPLAVQLAVPLFTEADISAMDDLIKRSSEAMAKCDLESLSLHNRGFHSLFFAKCGNWRLRQFLENLQAQNRIIAISAWRVRGFDEREHAEHKEVFKAVCERDGETAADLLRRHILRFGQSVLEIWPECCDRLNTKRENTS